MASIIYTKLGKRVTSKELGSSRLAHGASKVGEKSTSFNVSIRPSSSTEISEAWRIEFNAEEAEELFKALSEYRARGWAMAPHGSFGNEGKRADAISQVKQLVADQNRLMQEFKITAGEAYGSPVLGLKRIEAGKTVQGQKFFFMNEWHRNDGTLKAPAGKLWAVDPNGSRGLINLVAVVEVL